MQLLVKGLRVKYSLASPRLWGVLSHQTDSSVFEWGTEVHDTSFFFPNEPCTPQISEKRKKKIPSVKNKTAGRNTDEKICLRAFKSRIALNLRCVTCERFNRTCSTPQRTWSNANWQGNHPCKPITLMTARNPHDTRCHEHWTQFIVGSETCS